MSKIQYASKKFHKVGLEMIGKINEIADEYQRQGFKLTLRQGYYQLVARGIVPNSDSEYNRIGRLVADGRLAGLIDWSVFEDRTREAQNTYPPHTLERHNVRLQDIRNAIIDEVQSFYIPKWQGQPYYVEVWVEKSALEAVMSRACSRFLCPYFSARGYPSITALKDAADRFKKHTDAGKKNILIYLGDHDASGLDMGRNLKENFELLGADVSIERISLTMEQITQYNPPPNPAKETDTRSAAYIKQYGASSWELDALEPNVIVELVRNRLGGLFDMDIYSKMQDYREEQIEAARLKFKPIFEILDGLDEPA
jgi:hypothetical protein